ncbi:MAG TPA: HAD-IA family hydrolase [Bacilli bacterium]|nr:HAD-IA family hydrolase [Bacilli bacterium]
MDANQPKTGVVFDLDGTLLNTLQDLADSVNATLRQYGHAPRDLKEIKSFVGGGIKKLMQRALPEDISPDDFKERFEYFCGHYRRNIKNKTRPYPGVLRALRELKKAGAALAIVSNKFQEGVDALRDQFFSNIIDVAIGNQEGIMPKPAPDSLYLAIHKLGLDANKDRIFYVGDSEIDILTSRAAGIPLIAVSWGFRTESELLALNPEYMAAKPEDIVKIVRED